MRLIDADALREELDNTDHDGAISGYVYKVIKNVIENAPEVDARPVVHGRWEDEHCSVCGRYVYHGDAGNYCPNCGARMDEGCDDGI